MTIKFMNSGKVKIEGKEGIVDVYAGSHLPGVVKEMVKVFPELGIDRLEADFNGLPIVVTRGSDFITVLEDYNLRSEARSEAYKKSPEYKALVERQNAKKSSLQKKADELMGKLDSLDFKDHYALLIWLLALEDSRDYIGVEYDFERLQKKFIENGYQPNAYTDGTFDAENEEIFADWIIGQAIADKVVPPMVGKFTEDWFKKFRR